MSQIPVQNNQPNPKQMQDQHHSASSPFTFLNSAAQVVGASGKSSPFVAAGGFGMNNLSALASSSFSQLAKQNLA
jgi:hypothetical protein